MLNRVRLSASAQRDIADLHQYLGTYSSQTADAIIANLERVLQQDVAYNPQLYGWFYLLGQPLRARLFRISRRTQFWIVYEHLAVEHRVVIHRLWNASRDPAAFEL